MYCLFVRSSAEYCSVVWHQNLTQAQSNSIMRLQVVTLKLILSKDCPRKEDGHCDYGRVLILCKLDSLLDRQKKRMLNFGKKCRNHPSLSRLFPLNAAINDDPHNIRNHELCHVNHARTSAYRDSSIPAIQRQLNQYFRYSLPSV